MYSRGWRCKAEILPMFVCRSDEGAFRGNWITFCYMLITKKLKRNKGATNDMIECKHWGIYSRIRRKSHKWSLTWFWSPSPLHEVTTYFANVSSNVILVSLRACKKLWSFNFLSMLHKIRHLRSGEQLYVQFPVLQSKRYVESRWWP